MAEIDELTLTVPLDALEAGERHVLGERRELIHILSASEKKKTFMFIKRLVCVVNCLRVSFAGLFC